MSARRLSNQSRPGALGLSLYTYRVNDLEGYRRQIVASQASHVTSIRTDEFGQSAFSFRAPDGYDWTLVEDRAS